MAVIFSNAHLSINNIEEVRQWIEAGEVSQLVALSAGAVFFGAMTYIGNGPNFMVKAIADQSGIKMPDFGNYLFRFSIPILLPVLLLTWLIFFL